jgi:hypothetical protein
MLEIAKPRELLAAHTSAEVLFALLRDWFGVPDRVTLDLRAVDSAVAELADAQHAMAMAMRKLQSLHLVTTPGVRTTTDVVLTVIQDLERALSQAPVVHLRSEAAEADWDAELAAMGAEDLEGPELPEGDHTFDEIDRFRRHHAALRAAVRAVLQASDGQICVLV